MNKTIKGSLAAGAAAVLLLGGAGSLAYWTDAADVAGGTFNSGRLTLDDGVCDADWLYAGTVKKGGTITNFVPGDVISKTCTFTIGAEGDNLAATPVVPPSVDITPSAGKSFAAKVDATYTLAGTAYTGATKITEANDGNKLVATVSVTFPYGTDEEGAPIINGNDTQDIDAVLSNLTVSLTQDNPNATPAP